MGQGKGLKSFCSSFCILYPLDRSCVIISVEIEKKRRENDPTLTILPERSIFRSVNSKYWITVLCFVGAIMLVLFLPHYVQRWLGCIVRSPQICIWAHKHNNSSYFSMPTAAATSCSTQGFLWDNRGQIFVFLHCNILLNLHFVIIWRVMAALTIVVKCAVNNRLNALYNGNNIFS